MKKNFTLAICALLLSFTSLAQLSQTFDNLNLAGTPSTGAIPTTWSQNNVDGLVPASSLSYMGTDGWIARELLFSTGLDTVVQSISWYDPAGSSNDYLITPNFTVPTVAATDAVYLVWEEYTPDMNYPDGYEVKLSTTGTAPADFTTSLFSTTAASSSGFAVKSVDITSYSGQNVHMAFINNSNDKYILWLDDIRTAEVVGYDAVLSNINLKRYEKTSTNVTLTGTVQNDGKQITSMDIIWDAGSGPQTMNLTGLNIAPFQTYNFTHTVPFNESMADEFNVNVQVTNINSGVTELNVNNNSLSGVISTVANGPERNVVFEEGTGTWCGWCPRGEVAMKEMYNQHSDGTFIGIAVHNGDPMTVTAYDDGAGISGFPGCNVDRSALGESVSLAGWQTLYTSRRAEITPAAVDHTMTYDAATRALTIAASATFSTKISSGLRLISVLVEDSVHNGTDANYSQANYYSGGGSGAMGGYETLTDPVPAADMVYDHVGRALLGGYDGQAGSVTTPVLNAGTANYTFNYNVPASNREGFMKVVTMLLDEGTGEILNAKESKMIATPISVTDVDLFEGSFEAYPTLISNNILNLDINLNNKNARIEIYSYGGKRILQKDLGMIQGDTKLSIDLPEVAAGEYFVNLVTDKASAVRRIVIAK